MNHIEKVGVCLVGAFWVQLAIIVIWRVLSLRSSVIVELEDVC